MKLALCAVLPLAAGLVNPTLNRFSRKVRMIFACAVAAATSLCVFAALIWGGSQTFVLFRVSDIFVCEFGCDGLSRVFITLAAFLWPFAMVYATEYMEHESREGQFFTFYILAYAVTILLAASANAFTMYIFYECLTLITLPLVEHEQNKDSYRAGRSYLVYLIGGASLGFASMVITGVCTGGAAFTVGGAAISGVTLAHIAFILGFIGFGAKAAIFPLCGWLPKASVAPTPVTALLHAVAVVNAGVFAVVRETYFVFDLNQLTGSWAQYAALALSGFTIAYGAIRAARCVHFKRRLAWSTVSNLSYMLFACALMTDAGFTGALAHMVFHGLIKIVLFFCAGAVMIKTGHSYIYETRGLASKMPVTFAAFTVAGLALIGVPPLCGFTSKLLIITAAFNNGSVFGMFGAVCLIISAILTAVYIMSIVLPAYFIKSPGENTDPGIRIKAVLIMLCAAIIIVSAFGGKLTGLLQAIICA